jgi:NTE family protein
MLADLLDPFRLRQFFDVAIRVRDVVTSPRDDVALVAAAGRAIVPRPLDRPPPRDRNPFAAEEPLDVPDLLHRRVALMATGGSGALASLVGAARALEDASVRPSVISVCSGSALFGFPLAAGLPAEDVAKFALGLRPAEYIDPDWRRLALLAPTLGRGFAGILRGERVEQTYGRLLGDRRLGDLPIPAYAPVWNIEENRVEYIGTRTTPDLPVARAVRMAIALPLFIAPVEHHGFMWTDGGIVDIFPVHPVLDIEESCDVAVALNGFYPPGFTGEDETGWERKALSILHVANQVRTCQQAQLARENLARLEAQMDVVLIEPVPYGVVRGVGFYRHFLDTGDWPGFMRAGRAATRAALAAREVADRRKETGTAQ